METCVVMAVFLLLAVYHDIRTLKIPNWISLGGALAGLAIVSIDTDISAILTSVAGWLTGLIMMLPFYILRTMGAGDVKLVAMIGIYIGPQSMLGAIFYILIAGGIFSLLIATINGKLPELMTSIRDFMTFSTGSRTFGPIKIAIDTIPTSDKIPYSLPIMAGTMTWVFTHIV